MTPPSPPCDSKPVVDSAPPSKIDAASSSKHDCMEEHESHSVTNNGKETKTDSKHSANESHDANNSKDQQHNTSSQPPSAGKKKKKFDPYAASRSSLRIKSRKRKRHTSQEDSPQPQSTRIDHEDTDTRTSAERDLEKKRRRREEELIRQQASDSYREKVQKFNEQASKATDFNDMPRV